MKKYIIVLVVACSLFSCGTKYNYEDTGVSNAYFDGNMYQYLESSSYNWDSVRLMINRAELREVFEYDDITFMGLTNHSIRKWLIKGGVGFDTHGYTCINDIPKGMCRAIVLSLVLDGKMLRDEIERIQHDEKGNRIGGGRKLVTRYGNTVWLWTKQDPYMGVQGAGPVTLSMTALRDDGKTEISTNQVASTNIQPHNGVVQALQYSYNINDIGPLTEMK